MVLDRGSQVLRYRFVSCGGDADLHVPFFQAVAHLRWIAGHADQDVFVFKFLGPQPGFLGCHAFELYD